MAEVIVIGGGLAGAEAAWQALHRAAPAKQAQWKAFVAKAGGGEEPFF